MHCTSKAVFTGTLLTVWSIAELPFLAGNVALDFVNTAEERGHPDADDALRTPGDLRLWGQRYGLLSSQTPPANKENDRAELHHAKGARELLYGLFLAQIHHRTAPHDDLDRLSRFVASAHEAGTLEQSGYGQLHWQWSDSDLATVRHVAVSAAVDLLGDQPSTRLKQCPGEHCGWFFIDTTKRGNRRWCSMRECGQEAKTTRRRERSKPTRRVAP